MNNQQLELFPPSNSDLSLEISVTKQQIANVRKGLFRRYSEVNEELNKLRDEVRRLSIIIDGHENEANTLCKASAVHDT